MTLVAPDFEWLQLVKERSDRGLMIPLGKKRNTTVFNNSLSNIFTLYIT